MLERGQKSREKVIRIGGLSRPKYENKTSYVGC